MSPLPEEWFVTPALVFVVDWLCNNNVMTDDKCKITRNRDVPFFRLAFLVLFVYTFMD
jgi:hypothetical protein